jgi:DNA-binding LytR/AlgR family response regulator
MTNILIENAGEKIEVDINSLLYIVSDNVYQELICMEDQKITKKLVRTTMGNIEKSLNDYNYFLRCHRSYIVNTNRVTSIIGNSRQYYFVLEKSTEKIPISRSTANDVLEEFAYLLSN